MMNDRRQRGLHWIICSQMPQLSSELTLRQIIVNRHEQHMLSQHVHVEGPEQRPDRIVLLGQRTTCRHKLDLTARSSRERERERRNSATLGLFFIRKADQQKETSGLPLSLLESSPQAEPPST